MVVPDRKILTLLNVSLFKPVLRAYASAYGATTGPRLLSLVLSSYGKAFRFHVFLRHLRQIFGESLELNGFPAICGTLAGGYTILQIPLRFWFNLATQKCGWNVSRQSKIIGPRFLAAALAAWISFPLFNRIPELEKQVASRGEAVEEFVTDMDTSKDGNTKQGGCQPTPLAGKTMDLTLIVASRALEATIVELWSRYKVSRTCKGKWTSVESAISRSADPVVFAVSAGTVMWAWFYLPDRLPRAYNEWIASAAQVDHRLVVILRKARWGKFIYGKETGEAALLQRMCKEYNWPLVWGNPAKTIPLPCEVVHMGTGPSCHWHAAVRFFRAFRFSLTMYLPLQLLVRARKPSTKAFRLALKDAIRSSAFLGAFISLFYYSVCLSRTRIGPKIFSPETITPMMWDQGLCVGAGCVMCGWSIFLETPKRRQEVAFFVAPRAAATIFPRQYSRVHMWRERCAFALSTAVLLTFAQDDPAKVRGVLGQVLYRVLK